MCESQLALNSDEGPWGIFWPDKQKVFARGTQGKVMARQSLLFPAVRVRQNVGQPFSGPRLTCTPPQALDKMEKEWSSILFNVLPYKETDTYILKSPDEASQLLDDHIVMTQSMSFSPYKKPFEQRINSWENKLKLTQVGPPWPSFTPPLPWQHPPHKWLFMVSGWCSKRWRALSPGCLAGPLSREG